MFRRLLSRLAATFFGLKCDRCGVRGASLTVVAVRTFREERDGGRECVSKYAVKSCGAYCSYCRELS